MLDVVRASLPVMDTDERADLVCTCARVLDALRSFGGEELVADAMAEARAYCDLVHPWDGTGLQPLGRRRAEIGILARRLVRAVDEAG
jgi:hypothetical protein